MKGAHDFMAIVDERERVLASALFGAAMQDAESAATIHALSTLPPPKAANR